MKGHCLQAEAKVLNSSPAAPSTTKMHKHKTDTQTFFSTISMQARPDWGSGVCGTHTFQQLNMLGTWHNNDVMRGGCT